MMLRNTYTEIDIQVWSLIPKQFDLPQLGWSSHSRRETLGTYS